MNKISLTGISLFFLLVILSLANACSKDKEQKQYLKKILNNLNQIESASYLSAVASYAPGDTTPTVRFQRYVKEYINPTDTFVGAKFVVLSNEDTTKMIYCYDGNMRARVNWDEKTMEIDSFKNNRLPFRPIVAPFFTLVKRLTEYSLETTDSIKIESADFGDSVQFTFFIYDTVVEIIGTRVVYTPALYGTHQGDVSRYDIWINKSNDLPYKFKREMPHETSTEVCKNMLFNKDKIKDFTASDYFPDYPLHTRKAHGGEKVDLVGKKAPEWVLHDANNHAFALKDFKSKVFLIEFTSITCGPCLMSIPFLKQLSNEYDKKEFDFVSIESYINNSNALKRYQERNNLNYKFLMSTKEITQSYHVQAVPVFIILDENRIIRKIFRGYGKGTTDKKIRETVNHML